MTDGSLLEHDSVFAAIFLLTIIEEPLPEFCFMHNSER